MAVTTRVNLVTNPTFGVGTSGWSAVANCSVALGSGPDGGNGLRVTTTSSGTATITSSTGTSGITTSVGQQVAIQFKAKAGAAGRTATPKIVWYTSGGSVISTSTGSAVNLSTTAWTVVSMVATAPATAAKYAIAADFGGAAAGSETFDFSHVCGEASATVEPYFDGDTVNAMWLATRYTSASVLYAGVPDWTVRGSWTTGPDDSPSWSSATTVEEVHLGARGRSYEFDTVSPTRATIVVDNSAADRGPKQRTNLCTNPSIETGTTGWAAIGSATLSRSATVQRTGSYSLKVVTTATTGSGTSHTLTTPAKSTQHIASVWVYNPSGIGTSSVTFSVTGAVDTVAPVSTSTKDTWVRLTLSYRTSAYSGSVVHSITDGGTASAGKYFFVDDVLIETTTTEGDYFDGDTTGAVWNGTAHASTSVILNDYGIDKQVQVLGDGVELFTGVTDAAPAVLDSDGFDYATVQYSAIDYWDALGCVTLKSPMVMQTLEQSPVDLFVMDDPAGSTTATGSIGKWGAPLVHFGTGGVYAFGATSLVEPRAEEPTTAIAFEANDPWGAQDGGWGVLLGSTGAGVHLSGTQWTFRVVFESMFQPFQVLFSQVNSTSAADLWNKGVTLYLFAGRPYVTYPSGGALKTMSGASNICDGYAHVVEVRALASSVQLVVDGVVAATSAFACDSQGTNGPVTVGMRCKGDYTAAEGFFMGSIGHVAIFDSSYSGAVGVTVPDTMRKSYAGEAPATRLARVLDWVGFAGATSLASSSTVLGPQTSAGKSAADHIQETVDTDDGIFTFAGDGTATFLAGSGRYAGKDSVITLGLPSTPVDTSGLTFDLDRTYLANDIEVTRPGGPTFRLQDTTSIAKHRRRTPSSPLTFQVNTDADLTTRGNAHLKRYAYPRVRVGAVDLDPYTSPALAPYCLDAAPGDRITITNLPDHAPAETLDFLVESVEHDIKPDAWTVTLQLSPFFHA